MVFLTSLDIVDTGFLTVATRTSQLASTDRVNSGSAIKLKGVQFDLNITSNLDKAVTPDNHDIIRDSGAEKHPLISINPMAFTITIILNSKNTDTTNVWGVNDMALIASLRKLPQTRGLKAMYYPVDNAATGDTREIESQLIKQLGSADAGGTGQGDLDLTLWDGSASASSKDLTDVNYLACRFENCKFSQTPDRMIQITLTGVITS